ncbi:MAG: S9 family peptidase [Armatimonadetes bacterium]|nr:S9 family peptidase [Armatimonadota bacterium]
MINILNSQDGIDESENGYKLPSEKVTKIFNATSFPYFSFVPFDDIAFEMKRQSKQTLENISQPFVELAGEKISIKLNAPIKTYPDTSLTIHNFETGEKIPVKLPKNIKIRNRKLSFDHSKLALSLETENGIKLLIIDVETGTFKPIENLFINDVFGDGGFQWLSDNKTLLINSIPKNRGEIPPKPKIPLSPIIEETIGKISQTRTYQNLLKNKYDEELFDYYFTSQLVLIDVSNLEITEIGKSGIYSEVEIAPNNQFVFISQIQRPYSYELPYYRFPKKFQVWKMDGEVIKAIYDRPLQDQIPIGGTYIGPRSFRWQPLKDAALVWVEALDEGNPKKEVDFRDKILRLDLFSGKSAEVIFKTEHRFFDIDWSEDCDELIFSEYDRDKLWRRKWLFKIGDKNPRLIFDLSIRDRYNSPGDLVKKTTINGKQVFIKKDNNVYFINNSGATPAGNFPYLAKFNLDSKEKEILFRSRENFFERIYGFIGDGFNKIAIKSENQTTPPNFFFVNLDSKEREEISNYPHPYPDLTITKELIFYERNDGVPLTGILYLPANHQREERLPLVINAYPEEYADKSTAGQVKTSAERFMTFSGSSVRFFVLEGYAVLMRASIPIIGDPETVNETFIEQTVNSVKAAIDYLDERGIIDPQQVGIVGHSYGAFMVANVLAHSDLCVAGIGKTGAYNRTLTPFGFQSERRTFWEAKDFYMKVSPFMFAEKIKEPLLLIHGEDDPNSGTFPMQSKRMYQALKGNGATAKLVILPFEGHGYSAKESNLHVLAEMMDWFDKYVKKLKE